MSAIAPPTSWLRFEQFGSSHRAEPGLDERFARTLFDAGTAVRRKAIHRGLLLDSKCSEFLVRSNHCAVVAEPTFSD
jgi:hypothetical protein